MTKKRPRTAPNRFGNAGELNLSDSFDDPLNYGDNSFDDKDFVPEESEPPKIVATAVNLEKQIAKKKKLVSSHEIGIHNLPSTSTELEMTLDLNEEFDSISKTMPKSSPLPKFSEKRPEKDQKNPNTAESKDSIEIMLDYCKRILDRLNEQSARISLIEDVMCNNTKVNKMSLVNKTEESRTFSITNRLPLDNANDLKIFEENLLNSEFQDIAVSFFVVAIILYFSCSYIYNNILVNHIPTCM